MLRHYNDAEDVLRAPTRIKGDGIIAMPTEWNRSYRELERCIRVMRHTKPDLWHHVRLRYLACDTRTVDASVRNGKPSLPACCELAAGAVEVGAKTVRVRVRQWSPLVDHTKVSQGIDWISNTFRGEPYLPLEMTELAA